VFDIPPCHLLLKALMLPLLKVQTDAELTQVYLQYLNEGFGIDVPEYHHVNHSIARKTSNKAHGICW